MVDFPDAESPVNQIVNPRCFRSSFLSCRESEGCHVMFLGSGQLFLLRNRGVAGSCVRSHCEGSAPVRAVLNLLVRDNRRIWHRFSVQRLKVSNLCPRKRFEIKIHILILVPGTRR
jgi:hypothetical protein